MISGSLLDRLSAGLVARLQATAGGLRTELKENEAATGTNPELIRESALVRAIIAATMLLEMFSWELVRHLGRGGHERCWPRVIQRTSAGRKCAGCSVSA